MSGDDFDGIHALVRQGDPNEALRKLIDSRTGEIRSPFNQDLNHAWYIIGDIYCNKEDYEKAIFAFGRALFFWKDDADAYWALGDIYMELDNYVYAEKNYRKALKIDPNREDLMYNIGNALFDQGKYRRAIEWYKKVKSKKFGVRDQARKNLRLAESGLEESEDNRK